MTIRLLLVDDHELMREGLRAVLGQDAEFEIVGEASSGREAVELVGGSSPDVVIMDLAMKDLNGIEATRMIKSRWPQVGVVVLSAHEHRGYVTTALKAGADGYVLKSGAFADLCRAVRAVAGGRRYLSPDLSDIVIAVGTGANGDSTPPASVLAPREREVLRLVAAGLTSGAIATRLGVSTHTVDTHRRNLMRKVGLHNVADLTRYAIREGLASADE